MGAQLALHSAGSVWFISIALMALPDTLVPGVLFFIYSTVMIGAAPYLLRLMYSGKFWYTQPWFFGFEGYLDIETIESQIFGARLGRLQWSAWGSPLSRHHRNEHGECIGDDPTADPEVIEKVMRARSVVPGEQRVKPSTTFGPSFNMLTFQRRSSPSSTPPPWR